MKKKTKLSILTSILIFLIIIHTLFPNEPLRSFLTKVINKPSEIISQKNSSFAQKSKSLQISSDICEGSKAQVIKRQIGPYHRKILVRFEKNKDIKINNLVVLGDNFVGQVEKISDDRAWIILVSDPNFRLPVIIDSVSAVVILKGNVTSLLVDRVPGDNPIGGKTVFSSGTGENQISGIKIGIIEEEIESSIEGRLRTFTVGTDFREEFVNQVTICNAKDDF